MNAFRTYLVVVVLVVGAYTGVTIAEHGMTLYGVFFGDMLEMGWPGQFNLDFLFMLFFSGFWIAWRQHFSPAGLTLGFGGAMLGAPYLAVYLLFQIQRTNGDVAALLLGPERARALGAR